MLRIVNVQVRGLASRSRLGRHSGFAVAVLHGSAEQCSALKKKVKFLVRGAVVSCGWLVNGAGTGMEPSQESVSTIAHPTAQALVPSKPVPRTEAHL